MNEPGKRFEWDEYSPPGWGTCHDTEADGEQVAEFFPWPWRGAQCSAWSISLDLGALYAEGHTATPELAREICERLLAAWYEVAQ